MDTTLDRLCVGDAMHPGLITCAPETPLRSVARMLATYRVHAVLVTTHGGDELPHGDSWGVVSDVDVLRAATGDELDELPVREVVGAPALTVATGDDLGEAARLMIEHEVSHLVVLEPASGRPVGVLSTLDVVRALAGFPERHPVAF